MEEEGTADLGGPYSEYDMGAKSVKGGALAKLKRSIGQRYEKNEKSGEPAAFLF